MSDWLVEGPLSAPGRRKISRRGFVTTTAVAAAGAAVFPAGPTLSSVAAAAPRNRSLASLHLNMFQHCRGEQFRASHDHGTTLLELTSAKRSGPRSSALTRGEECFALEFRRLHGSPMAQGTYTVAHATLGKFALFLVPNGVRGRSYTAIINRIVTP